ncbi:helix-turn-helix transcriptional regulator [Nostoc parmelioides]|uniref:Helix-turn-helix transcriptional regulator n=1 Tax=Nostoc parmelioides FACHB-3921 TaxID=2692909 RepID=A0ABR8BRE1_9NOSO|nr:helix-turn-helix transcriptional regulator [Nostoc parmelioides]MBD2255503.1 helix-turn-helix transcriptional regulator [Nostoc parmelioides FACHB-3921]
METLTQADWQRILEFLQSLYIPCSFDKFPIKLLADLSKLLDAEIFSITSFTLPNKPFLPRVYTFPIPEVGMAAELFISQPHNFFAHPVAQHYAQTMDRQALAISDFFTESLFHCHCPLYTDFFQKFSLEDQMMIQFDVPFIGNADPFHQGQDQFIISINRDRRNFTERDRLILNLIRPQIKQAYENRVTFNQLQQQLVQQQQATEQVALILISVDGSLKWMTQKAQEILQRYFQLSSTTVFLPAILQRWVNHQIFELVQSTKPFTPPCPLYLESKGQRLMIRLNYNPELEQVYLLLEETQPKQFSVDTLQMLGLTKREAEVLFWVAKDLSTREVAKQLGMSDRTVMKHLEHVYEKFGVQTRLAAVMYVLNHLGILNQ